MDEVPATITIELTDKQAAAILALYVFADAEGCDFAAWSTNPGNDRLPGLVKQVVNKIEFALGLPGITDHAQDLTTRKP